MLFIPYGSPLLTYYIGGPKGTNLHLHINFLKFWGASKVSVSFFNKKNWLFWGGGPIKMVHYKNEKKKELGIDEAPFIYLIESNKRYPQSNKEYDNGFCSKGCFWKILAKLDNLAKNS
jgi:hypothetical protein